MVDKPLPDAPAVLATFLATGTVAATCREWSITRSQFKNLLRGLGLATTPRRARKRRDAGVKRGPCKLSPSRLAWRELVKGYYLDGLTGSEIARRYNKTRQAVNLMIRKLGLTEKDRGSAVPSFFSGGPTMMIIDDPYDASKPPMTDEQQKELLAWWDKAKGDSRIVTSSCKLSVDSTGQFVTTDWKESNG